jgi:hypothetical protein
MSTQRTKEAVSRARFAVRDLTHSRVSSDEARRGEQLRAQRLRDIGWGESVDDPDTRADVSADEVMAR